MELEIKSEKHKKLVKYLRELIKDSIFENHVFIVGGFVRDSILGTLKDDADVDLVIDTESGGIVFSTWLAYHAGCYVQGKNPCVFPTYGTAKMQIYTSTDFSDIQIECVQTRKEKYDRKSRNPETAFGSIEEDAMRRDLTINALYYNITTGEVMDYSKRGLDDIKNHVIRTTGKPDDVFADDPLRVLRVIRFAHRLGWKIEKNTWFGLINNAKSIASLTPERVTDELNKILLSESPSKAITMFDRCNVLPYLMPYLIKAKHIYQDLRPRRTLYEHILDTLDRTPPVIETRLAALFHDLGKIKTYDKGFMFHQHVSAECVEIIMKAMKYSNAMIDTVKKAVENHEAFSQYSNRSIPRPQVIRKFVAKFDGNDHDLEVALDLMHANNISQMYGKKVRLVPGIKEKIAELDKKQESGKKIVLPIDGHMVMKEFKIKPGPILGVIIKKIREKVIENPSLSREDALAIAKKCLQESAV